MARQTIVSTQQAERITDRALRHIRPIFGKCYGYPSMLADEGIRGRHSDFRSHGSATVLC